MRRVLIGLAVVVVLAVSTALCVGVFALREIADQEKQQTKCAQANAYIAEVNFGQDPGLSKAEIRYLDFITKYCLPKG